MANKSFRDDRTHNMSRAVTAERSACVNVGRVFDSCCDRDCLEDLKTYFPSCHQRLINEAATVRAKDAKVLGMCIDVEELPFQEGYYNCKLTFYIEINVEVCDACGNATCVKGCTAFEKKVILYGGEGGVQVFHSDMTNSVCDRCELSSSNKPHCTVQVAQPVVLDVYLREANACQYATCCCSCDRIPEQICAKIGGDCCEIDGGRSVVVTVGLFTIVQLVRDTQMTVPFFEYCVPCKECHCDEETPCDLFNKMSFPVEEFFPPACKNGKK